MRACTAIISVLLVFGCEKSQSYFDAHPDARKAAMTSCASGTLGGRACQNAALSTAGARHADAEQTFKNMSEGR